MFFVGIGVRFLPNLVPDVSEQNMLAATAAMVGRFAVLPTGFFFPFGDGVKKRWREELRQLRVATLRLHEEFRAQSSRRGAKAETIIRQEVKMALRDEEDREIQKMLSDSGVFKELMSFDGVMRVSERLNDIRGGLSWWFIRKKDKDGGTYVVFGS